MNYLWLTFISTSLFANPYPDPTKVPTDPLWLQEFGETRNTGALGREQIRSMAIKVLRIQVKWIADTESYEIEEMFIENSGSTNLLARAIQEDTLGSYRATLTDGQSTFHGSIGTGMEYRKLVRAITFRFPVPSGMFEFVLRAENPQSGIQEEVLRKTLDIQSVPTFEFSAETGFEVRQMQASGKLPALMVGIYSEGYSLNRKEAFFDAAAKVVSVLKDSRLESFDQMGFWAIFHPSEMALGGAKDLGLPVKERNSFLGLFFPYWNKFGRWYHVIYPTRESRFKRALSSFPYDYPIILADSDRYWGVGNFNEHTALPAASNKFRYLLLHELGHFMGLNEEYEGGGKTELAFAPDIDEPWSQNITFLKSNKVKWHKQVSGSTPIPTPKSHWQNGGPIGAYLGGYADTPPLRTSHKPGFDCVMGAGKQFCQVCQHAIRKKIRFDLGYSSAGR